MTAIIYSVLHNKFMKKLLLTTLALPFLLSVEVNSADRVHEICKDVRDYYGCVKSNKRLGDKRDFSQIKDLRLKRLEQSIKCIENSNDINQMKACKKPMHK